MRRRKAKYSTHCCRYTNPLWFGPFPAVLDHGADIILQHFDLEHARFVFGLSQIFVKCSNNLCFVLLVHPKQRFQLADAKIDITGLPCGERIACPLHDLLKKKLPFKCTILSDFVNSTIFNYRGTLRKVCKDKPIQMTSGTTTLNVLDFCEEIMHSRSSFPFGRLHFPLIIFWISATKMCILIRVSHHAPQQTTICLHLMSASSLSYNGVAQVSIL